MTPEELLVVVESNIEKFCYEFLREPYMCYTEHGLHAQFYHQFLQGQRQDFKELPCCLNGESIKVSRIQKEYPTAHDLGKKRRQNWDIAIISEPCISRAVDYEHADKPYDYLELHSVVEFGLNEYSQHLNDDIDRVCHKKSNILYGKFIVHLVRINEDFSGRDRSPRSVIKKLTEIEIAALTTGKDVTIYYGKVDLTGTLPRKKELWLIKNGVPENLLLVEA